MCLFCYDYNNVIIAIVRRCKGIKKIILSYGNTKKVIFASFICISHNKIVILQIGMKQKK